jgi:hypothetical protein
MTVIAVASTGAYSYYTASGFWGSPATEIATSGPQGIHYGRNIGSGCYADLTFPPLAGSIPSGMVITSAVLQVSMYIPGNSNGTFKVGTSSVYGGSGVISPTAGSTPYNLSASSWTLVTVSVTVTNWAISSGGGILTIGSLYGTIAYSSSVLSLTCVYPPPPTPTITNITGSPSTGVNTLTFSSISPFIGAKFKLGTPPSGPADFQQLNNPINPMYGYQSNSNTTISIPLTTRSASSIPIYLWLVGSGGENVVNRATGSLTFPLQPGAVSNLVSQYSANSMGRFPLTWTNPAQTVKGAKIKIGWDAPLSTSDFTPGLTFTQDNINSKVLMGVTPAPGQGTRQKAWVWLFNEGGDNFATAQSVLIDVSGPFIFPYDVGITRENHVIITSPPFSETNNWIPGATQEVWAVSLVGSSEQNSAFYSFKSILDRIPTGSLITSALFKGRLYSSSDPSVTTGSSNLEFRKSTVELVTTPPPPLAVAVASTSIISTNSFNITSGSLPISFDVSPVVAQLNSESKHTLVVTSPVQSSPGGAPRYYYLSDVSLEVLFSPVPLAPLGLTCSPTINDTGIFNLNWTNPAGPITGKKYQIDSGSIQTVAQSTGPNALDTRMITLSSFGTHTVKLWLYNGYGYNPANLSSIDLTYRNPIPEFPINLQVTNSPNLTGLFNLTWTNPPAPPAVTALYWKVKKWGFFGITSSIRN